MKNSTKRLTSEKLRQQKTNMNETSPKNGGGTGKYSSQHTLSSINRDSRINLLKQNNDLTLEEKSSLPRLNGMRLKSVEFSEDLRIPEEDTKSVEEKKPQSQHRDSPFSILHRNYHRTQFQEGESRFYVSSDQQTKTNQTPSSFKYHTQIPQIKIKTSLERQGNQTVNKSKFIKKQVLYWSKLNSQIASPSQNTPNLTSIGENRSSQQQSRNDHVNFRFRTPSNLHNRKFSNQRNKDSSNHARNLNQSLQKVYDANGTLQNPILEESRNNEHSYRNNTSLGISKREKNQFISYSPSNHHHNNTSHYNFKCYTSNNIKLGSKHSPEKATTAVSDLNGNNNRPDRKSPHQFKNEPVINDITQRLMQIADTYNKALQERKVSHDSRYQLQWKNQNNIKNGPFKTMVNKSQHLNKDRNIKNDIRDISSSQERDHVKSQD